MPLKPHLGSNLRMHHGCTHVCFKRSGTRWRQTGSNAESKLCIYICICKACIYDEKEQDYGYKQNQLELLTKSNKKQSHQSKKALLYRIQNLKLRFDGLHFGYKGPKTKIETETVVPKSLYKINATIQSMNHSPLLLPLYDDAEWTCRSVVMFIYATCDIIVEPLARNFV